MNSGLVIEGSEVLDDLRVLEEQGTDILACGTCVVLFHSISGALRAEKLLKAESVPLKLIPVPRHLSSDCGICIRFECADKLKVEGILGRSKLEIQGIHHENRVDPIRE